MLWVLGADQLDKREPTDCGQRHARGKHQQLALLYPSVDLGIDLGTNFSFSLAW